MGVQDSTLARWPRAFEVTVDQFGNDAIRMTNGTIAKDAKRRNRYTC
jgi:hypothetical protein